MIYGQETNSWYEKENGTIDDIQTLYDGFLMREIAGNMADNFGMA